MEVSREEILHIAKLANLNLKEEEIEKSAKKLEEILNFAQIINNANTDEIKETIMSNENYNVFRKDEIVEFEDKEALLQNAPTKEEGMFQIPKVIN